MNSRTRNALAVVAALALFGAAGCTDTTVEPQSTITQTNVFNDVNTYKGFIARVYAGLAVSGQQGPAGRPDIQGIDEGFSQYLRLFWEAQELPTDAAVIGWGDVGLPEMNTQMWAASNSFVVAMYYRIFFQVAMANEFLRETSQDRMAARNVSAEVNNAVQTYRAEARFLRALSYWHGIDLFGDIPFVTEEDQLGATPPQQSTREEIFDFIVTELNEIRTQLPAGAGTYGRATPAAASMLLAKLYLNSEVYTGTPRYADALAAAQQAIAAGYTLDTNWRRMFMADNHNSPEIIFPVTQDGLRTQTWGGMTFIVHASVGGNTMNASNYGVDGGWWGLRLKPQTYRLFEDADHRNDFFFTEGQNVEVNSISDWFSGVAAPKYSNLTSTGSAGSNRTHVDTDFPMFRLADAYLMYAEAHLRGGGGTRAQALAYVNALRQRAYGGTDGNIADAALTLDFIIDERGRELMWEAHRRTDLIRFGLFTGGDYLWAWKGGVQAGRSTETFRNLYPLPANELVANPNLTQNPGY
ncbi:MAG TPA: RagB/SusD family nutrient uptake outer membrane protein [Longimicrobiales bacterium]|nr:RagB/SusD family nutrient uptake outer membrane protein [Longimicrobiales bacterium]